MITEHIIILRDPEIRMIKEAKSIKETSNTANDRVLSKDYKPQGTGMMESMK